MDRRSIQPLAKGFALTSLVAALLLGGCGDSDPAVTLSGGSEVDSSDVISGSLDPTASGIDSSQTPGGTEPGGTEPGGTEPGGTEPGGTEPGGTEPGGTEPGGTEPGGTEPGGTEPGGTEPGGTEPGGTEPGGTEPGGTEPGGTEPGGTEPGGTEPGGTEPGGTEPGGTEPGGTEPGGTEPGGTEPGGTEPPEPTDPTEPGDDLCESNEECERSEYCLFFADNPCGEGGGQGQCVVRPEGCEDIYEPVCGCDGMTYGNACEAASAGMNVASEGRCEADLETCGDSADCERNEYCAYGEDNICGEDGDGVCLTRPGSCPRIVDPHCGCDGRTYTNACLAHQAGVDVVGPGECPQDRCRDNEECARHEYCWYDPLANACGEAADEAGTCRDRSDCEPITIIVCGCDGQDYGSPCDAAAAGVNVVSFGPCAVEPPPEGCRENRDCGRLEYCFFDPAENACGQAEEPGTCMPTTEICLPVIDPVCGCDGRTWNNDCEAASRGVNILHAGPCEGVPTGCLTSQDCARSEYCVFPDSDVCGDEGTRGRCIARPFGCLPVDEPVCGCDGRTYGNECAAATVGVDVREAGACDGGGTPDACRSNDDCASRLDFCRFDIEDRCGVQGAGVCEERPSICQPVFDPVCGCDNRTYSNACAAFSAGVSVQHLGVCRGGGIPGPSPR